MINREFLMLAKNYESKKHKQYVVNWFVSEKLDGIRCFWDGGISRGLLCKDVPFANTKKDSRYKADRLATGLWTRYGKPIYAPDWFIKERLGNYPFCLDGELYAGRGKFQETVSTVKSLTPGPLWNNIRYKIFDLPSIADVFIDGKINNPNYQKLFINVREWAIGRLCGFRPAVYKFSDVYDYLVNSKLDYLEQNRIENEEELYSCLEKVSDNGGEGLILRDPNSRWCPRRTDSVLKVKKLFDDEGVVVGHNLGKGKYEGMMGSLKISWREKEFDLSGFTDSERDLTKLFKLGTVITFTYRELTIDGIPKEARYLRNRE